MTEQFSSEYKNEALNKTAFSLNNSLPDTLVEVLPEVVAEKLTDDAVELTLWIPAGLPYFKGHFPNVPILAGVVQLHWAVQFAKQKLSLSATDVKNVEVLKFKVVIVPDQKLVLTLTKKTNEKFLFSYQSEKGQHASGRIVLECAS